MSKHLFLQRSETDPEILTWLHPVFRSLEDLLMFDPMLNDMRAKSLRISECLGASRLHVFELDKFAQIRRKFLLTMLQIHHKGACQPMRPLTSGSANTIRSELCPAANGFVTWLRQCLMHEPITTECRAAHYRPIWPLHVTVDAAEPVGAEDAVGADAEESYGSADEVPILSMPEQEPGVVVLHKLSSVH
jgi:hypothetical protein